MNPAESLLGDCQPTGLSEALTRKWMSLSEDLHACRSVVVAYSGGVDSGLLAVLAHRILGDRMVAVTIDSPLESPDQRTIARDFAQEHGFQHHIISVNPLLDPYFCSNRRDRCYHCKKSMLQLIWEFARSQQIPVVLEGQHRDDQDDYRPGRRAVNETHTRSPFAEHGWTKEDIRGFAKVMGLSIWNRPSSPCLASRFPYDTVITEKALNQVAAAEQFFHDRGFDIVRVRYYGDSVRIEIMPDRFYDLIDIREETVAYLETLEFTSVSLDLLGFRSGSLNKGIER